MFGKLLIVSLVALVSKIAPVYAQYALPTFQAVHKRSATTHPGYDVTGLTFDNHEKWGTGDDCISIPWSTSLKEFTVDDSTSFTVSIRAKLPSGSHYYRRNDYYTSPSHTMRAGYYYDGGKRLLSGLYNSSGAIDSDLEYGITRTTAIANHTTTWSGKHSENIQSIYYDSKYWYWIGYRGTANPSTGVYTSSDDGVKLWMKENGNNDAYNPNRTMSDVLIESSASGNHDFIRVTYSSLSDMTSGSSGTIVSTGLGSTGVGTGSINYVLDLDGTNDYVSLPNSINMGTSDFTLSIWLKTDDVSSRQHVFQQTGSNDNRVIAINSGGSLTSRLGGSGSDQLSGVTLSTDTWYHIVLVHDNSENTLKWYVNGTEQNTNTSVNVPSNTGTFYLGTNSDADDKFFNGQIDEVRIWNDVRTAAEIADNKDDELVGNESGLVAYYKMSDGTGTTLTDNSSNSNNGTLTNMVTSGASTDWVITNAPIAYDNVYTDYGPDGSYSTNCMHFYLNGSLNKTHGFTDNISGSTSGTGYLGQNIYDFGGGDNGPYTRLLTVTEWVLLSYCNPSEVNSLHSSQGSSDLRPWAAGQGKSLAIYYSLTDEITDGDTVEDLSGNGRNGSANGFGN
jgi:hypothetical protein